MSKLDGVRAAVAIALRESTFDAEALSALHYVRRLPFEIQIEARAAVQYVYQTGRAPHALRTGRTSRRVA